MVIRKSDICRFFTIERAVAFRLISVAVLFPVEIITIMNPNVIITLLQSNAVAFVTINEHNPEVANFGVREILETNAESVKSRVLADTFQRNPRQCLTARVRIIPVNQQIATRKIFRIRYRPDYPNTNRARFIIRFERVENILNTCIRASLRAVFFRVNFERNRVFILLR